MEEDSLKLLPTAEEKQILKSYFSVNDTVNTMNLDPHYKVVVIVSL